MPYVPYLGLVALAALVVWNLDRHDTAWARALFAAFAVVAIAFLAIHSTGRGTPFGDFDKAYYPAGHSIFSDPSRLYDCSHADGLCFVNAPIVALVFAPLAALAIGTAHVVVTAISLTAVVLAAWLLLVVCGATGTQRFAILALIVLNGPLYYSVRLANLTHVVLLLVLMAVYESLRQREGRAGSLLGLAALLKPPLLIWLAYFVLRRRWRASAAMAATLGAAIGLSVAMFGIGLHLAWSRQFVVGAGAHPIGAYNVQSIAGFLVRLTASGTLVDWTPVQVSPTFRLAQLLLTGGVIALAIVAGAVAGPPRTRAARLRDYSILICVMLLVSPVSWTHYYCLLLLPLAAYLARTAGVPTTGRWRLGMGTAALLVSMPVMLWVPSDRILGPLIARVLLSHYVFGGAFLLAICSAASLRVRESEERSAAAQPCAPRAADGGRPRPQSSGTAGDAVAAASAAHVSVVVSTFNRAESLRRTLDSLLQQDVPVGIRYEIIVVDNNSADATAGVVASYVEREPGCVRYVFEPRQGVSHGRNAGIAVSAAPIVAFTDDDNEVDRRWIATIKATLDAHPEVVAVGGRILPESHRETMPQWLNRHHWGPLAILDYGDRPFDTSSSNPRCLLTANLAVRRDVFDQIGGFSPAFQRCQDHELLIRLWRAGHRALYTPDLVVYTSIERERLTRRYHREWHSRRGEYAALMQLQEIIDGSGRLVAPPEGAIRLYGTPGFVYRELGREAARTLVALARFDRAEAAAHQHQVQYLATYIRRMAAAERRSPVRRLLEPFTFVRAHLRKQAAAVSMPVGSLVLAGAITALTAAGSLYDIVRDREHWPFSQYPMFSSVEREPILESLRVFGVTGEPTPREVPLLDGRFIEPFDQCRLTTAFQRTYYNPARRPAIDMMLRDVLVRYERLRAAGEHDGPALQAVRLYDLQWTLDPDASNVSTPGQRTLLDEVRMTTDAGAR